MSQTFHIIGYIIFMGARVDVFDVTESDVIKVLSGLSDAQETVRRFGNAEGIVKGRIQVLTNGTTTHILPVFDR